MFGVRRISRLESKEYHSPTHNVAHCARDAPTGIMVAYGAWTLTTEIESMRPVAIEGQTLGSFALFIPISLVAIAAAGYFRAAAQGLACSVWAASCRTANQVPAHPISLGIPAGRLHSFAPSTAWLGHVRCRWPASSSSSSPPTSSRLHAVIAWGGLPFSG